jgi:hypothetical protein
LTTIHIIIDVAAAKPYLQAWGISASLEAVWVSLGQLLPEIRLTR